MSAVNVLGGQTPKKDLNAETYEQIDNQLQNFFIN